MSSQIRQIRLRAKRLDFEAMREDLELLERLASLRIPKGRKSADMQAQFTVRARGEGDIPAKFTASPYRRKLDEFMESGEKLSVLSIGDNDPAIARQRLNRLIERIGIPVRAQVINAEVYLERT